MAWPFSSWKEYQKCDIQEISWKWTWRATSNCRCSSSWLCCPDREMETLLARFTLSKSVVWVSTFPVIERWICSSSVWCSRNVGYPTQFWKLCRKRVQLWGIDGPQWGKWFNYCIFSSVTMSDMAKYIGKTSYLRGMPCLYLFMLTIVLMHFKIWLAVSGARYRG